MKTLISFVLVALFATFVVAGPNCGLGGAPDATRPSMCNCYSGYAPSTKASTDCNVNPLCPPIEKTANTIGEYGANRPVTSFAADRLNVYQSLPIVANRLGATIRFVNPVGIPGVTPGAPGSSTCGYPGALWNKTVNELTCMDEFRGSIPWNSNGMCGFVLDTTKSTNSTAVYRTTMVTQFNETFTGWKGQSDIRVQSNAYSISVSFLKQKQVSNLVVNVKMDSPVLTLSVIGNVLFDSESGTTGLTLRTSATWPYQIDASSVAFASFTSTADQAPAGVSAQINLDTSASLTCGTTQNSLCYQQWVVTVFLGDASNCDIEGLYNFTSNLLCRDGAACGGAPTGSFAFSLMPTDFCDENVVDATANSVYILHAFQDAAHELPAATFSIGQYVYFDLSVVDPTSTLRGITFSSIALVPSDGPRDTLYSTTGTPAVTGINLSLQEVKGVIAPGTTADLGFSFQLMGPYLPNTLGQLSSGGSVTVSVEATLDLVYYGGNKRDLRVAMEMSQGAATTTIQIISEDDQELTNSSPVYTIPFFTILALLSLVLL